MIKRLLILLILLVAVPCWGFDINTTNCDDSDATTFCIQTSETTVDGDTRCHDSFPGSTAACAGGDTLYLEGGSRQGLTIQDFDGSGTYITITNDPTGGAKATISENTYADINITNCQYLDLNGNAAPGTHTYGIYAYHISNFDNSITVSRDSDYIKLGYLEIEGRVEDPYESVNGIRIGYVGTPVPIVFSNFEIHHNYLHTLSYSGMYIGHNEPHLGGNGECTSNVVDGTCPYVENFSIHDNLFVDMGAYAMTFKGVVAGSTANYIYDNIVRPSDRTSGGGYSTGLQYTGFADDLIWGGLFSKHLYAGATVEIYDNYIEKPRSMGIKVLSENISVYRNIIVGAGNGGEGRSNGAITVEYNNLDDEAWDYAQIYDNIIVQAGVYGIVGTSGEGEVNHFNLERNIIVDTPTEYLGSDVTEGTQGSPDCSEAWGTQSGCANVYAADTDSICFTTWSDDSDYSNDDFTLCCDYDFTPLTGVVVAPHALAAMLV